MKIVGTIVEFNPLHNGHLYALHQIKKESHADVVVAVMSGNFTMRGELSLFNKFEKTKQALNAGIDVIVELPFVYSVENADFFASEAIRLLSMIKVDELWIGSEQNNPMLYEEAYQQWLNPKNQELIQVKLKSGASYKDATTSILEFESNDLLGFAYYKAIQEKKLRISIHTIQRVGSGYLDEDVKIFASSYAIRKNLELMKTYCPEELNPNLIQNQNQLFPYLKYQILSQPVSHLKQIFLVDEGIEHRLKQVINYTNLEDFIQFLVTKRYTRSRIQRTLAYLFFQITKKQMEDIRIHPEPFVRILGMNQNGLDYLNQIKKEVSIKTNIKDGLHPVYDIELKISKLLDFIYQTNHLTLEQKGPFIKNKMTNN